MSNPPAPPDTPGGPAEVLPRPRGMSVLRLEVSVFLGLLALALLGAALNQADDVSRWIYWSVLVLIYGGVGIAASWVRSRRRGLPTWASIRGEVLHWLGTLVAIKIVLLFELEDITARGAAADMSLVLLALGTFLAGVHFNWAYLPLGVILAAIAVGLGFLDQFSIFLVTIPLAVLAVILVARHLHTHRT
jgi:hypothetical protein